MAIAHGARTLVVRQMTAQERMAAQDRQAVRAAEARRVKGAFSERWDMRDAGWDRYDFAWRRTSDGNVEYVRVSA